MGGDIVCGWGETVDLDLVTFELVLSDAVPFLVNVCQLSGIC
jgi:hypothetical protein